MPLFHFEMPSAKYLVGTYLASHVPTWKTTRIDIPNVCEKQLWVDHF